MNRSALYSWVPQLGPDDVEDIADLFAQTWWTRDRDRNVIEALLRSAAVFAGLRDEDGRLVACVRALTDGRCKALVVDVIVDEPLRKLGLGARLMWELLRDERLVNVEDLELYCASDLIPFYQQYGFQHLPETHFMRLSRRSGMSMP